MAILKFDRDALAGLLGKLAKPTDEILLVKDDGIYLMSGNEPRPVGETGTSWRRTVVYARGYDPAKDHEVWDRAREAVGGDDFAERLSTREDIVAVLDDSVGDIAVEITPRSLSIGHIPKTPEPPSAKVKAGRRG